MGGSSLREPVLCPHGRNLGAGEPCALCGRVTSNDWPFGLEPEYGSDEEDNECET